MAGKDYLWGVYAHFYDDSVMAYHPYLRMMGLVIDWVHDNEISDILDLGTGTGNLPMLLRHGRWAGRITGIDLTEQMLRVARKKNPGVEFVRGSFDRVREQSAGSRQAIVALNSLYVLADPEDIARTLAHCRDALRPGGRLCIAVLHEIDPENMIRAELDLPAVAPRNNFWGALTVGLRHRPGFTLRVFRTGIVTRLLGGQDHYRPREEWRDLITAAEFSIEREMPYYGAREEAPRHDHPAGTMFFCCKPA